MSEVDSDNYEAPDSKEHGCVEVWEMNNMNHVIKIITSRSGPVSDVMPFWELLEEPYLEL